MTTSKPVGGQPRAIAAPIPRAAPVTSALRRLGHNGLPTIIEEGTMTDRWFSEEELEQLSRPTMDRAIEAIDAGELERRGACALR